MFKKKKSIRLSYAKQGLIYFTCLTYRIQPPDVKKNISDLCSEIAEENSHALFSVLTSENKTLESIAFDEHLPVKYLSHMRSVFYQEWDRRFL